MKIVNKFILMACFLVALPVFGKGIIWDGHWNVEAFRNVQIPILGNIDENTGEVTLSFTQDLGIVTVTVTSPDGNIIYQENVKTDVVPNFTIPLEQTKGCIVSVTDGDNLIYTTIDL